LFHEKITCMALFADLIIYIFQLVFFNRNNIFLS